MKRTRKRESRCVSVRQFAVCLCVQVAIRDIGFRYSNVRQQQHQQRQTRQRRNGLDPQFICRCQRMHNPTNGPPDGSDTLPSVLSQYVRVVYRMLLAKGRVQDIVCSCDDGTLVRTMALVHKFDFRIKPPRIIPRMRHNNYKLRNFVPKCASEKCAERIEWHNSADITNTMSSDIVERCTVSSAPLKNAQRI